MKLRNIFKTTASVIISASLCGGILTGCSLFSAPEKQTLTESRTGDDGNAPVSVATEKNEESGGLNVPENTGENSVNTEKIRITALSGPTAMGMTKMMSDNDSQGYGFEGNYDFEFNIVSAVDEVSPLVVKGDTDIFCVPANLASVLYNKTEGNVQVLAVNTLGVIYICENGDTVKDISDLKGKTVYASGKGATPEYALNYVLTQNGIDPENDLTIEWKSEHAECLASLLADENGVAMLPQPFVTSAQIQNENINVVLDLTEEWDKLGGESSMITGVVAVRKEFAAEHPEAVNEFLTRYAASVEYVNNNVSEAAQLVEQYGIIKAAVAEKAIPKCNIVCITASDMKTALSGYLGVLFGQNPTSVGGSEPKDDFYYGA